ncbi:acyl-CoA oxidase [Streptomyces sp. ISL-112]|uniref:acyl-CoA dehydrogenase family protein n=1 Tax=unclassified Streptomyces TaxID=2593676 RepID=UPI001BE94216|nr:MULTISPECIES: acyl-CoA oxidase [unclassified Streptomyces]MBT2425500.1 acyl-CoA oxidase [Streptomyces sp. ISL-112]MBT2465686.1 acyl-CoA oxidase [Streptomyces sp. ISL-63]
MTLPPSALPETARDEIHRLLHGFCDPSSLSALTTLGKALADDPGPGAKSARGPATGLSEPVHGPGQGPVLLRRLRAMAEALPPGAGLLDDPARLAAVHACAAVADPSLCLAGLVHHLLCLSSLTELSDDPGGLEPRLSALREGRAKGVYLITEAGQANSHLDTGTRADLDPVDGSFVLHTPDSWAAKFGSAGTWGVEQTGVVLARLFARDTDCGVFAFMVDLTDEQGPLPGVELSSPVALDALPLDYVHVRFHGVRVPRAHWLSDGARIDRDGTVHDPAGSPEQRLQRTLRVGQGLWAAMPAVAAATSRRSAVQAVNYARQRRTQSRIAPGVPLLSYRTQQTVVLGALADAFALTCAADGALAVRAQAVRARAVRAQAPPPKAQDMEAMGFTPWAAVSQPLAAYKAVTVRTAARLTAECQHRCGFSGHLTVNRLAAYQGFHHAFDTAGGDSQLIFYDIGRSLVEQAQEPAQEPEPIPDPASPLWWPAVLRRHQHDLVRELRRRDDTTVATRDPFGRWDPLLEQAGLLGEAHATQMVADDVTRVLGRLRDQDLVRALTPLAALHGVLAAHRWAGSLLTLRTLHPADMEALPGVTDRLREAIMGQLTLLLAVFGETDESSPAPLAAPDVNAAMAATLTWTRGSAS